MHILAENYKRLFGVDLISEGDDFTTDKYDNDPNIVKHSKYVVKAHSDRYVDEVYEGYDYEEAYDEYEMWTINDVAEDKFRTMDHSVELMEFITYYRFNPEDPSDQMEDFPVEDHFDDEDLYEMVSEEDGYYRQLKWRNVDGINRNADELLDYVRSHFGYKYSVYAMKYFDIDVEDNEGEHVGYIKLRISNHTPNLTNITRFGTPLAQLSVTISDQDPTRGKFMAGTGEFRGVYVEEMIYSGEDLKYKDEVIEEIEARIEELVELYEEKANSGEFEKDEYGYTV